MQRNRVAVDCPPSVNIMLQAIAGREAVERGKRVTITDVVFGALSDKYPEIKELLRNK